MSKNILFLSAIDFKEKSIQVIIKTPLAYQQHGWNVHYIVARDDSQHGSYFYEKPLHPAELKIQRFSMPGTKIYNYFHNKHIKTIFSKFRIYASILMLTYKAFQHLKSQKTDIIYGYEVHGFLAVLILKSLGQLKNIQIISRFQGTYFADFIKSKSYLKIILNWEHFVALKASSDLCIMTNDGTQGAWALNQINSGHLSHLKFWVNGVDLLQSPSLTSNLNSNKKNIFQIITICRLESWKRVDRAIEVINLLVNKLNFQDLHYTIIGDGEKKSQLIDLVNQYQLNQFVTFTGAIKHSEVQNHLLQSNAFISTYDLSNVGNPLLEAIRAHKIIFTLNNGDTGSWIQHRKNGFIYDIQPEMFEKMALDIKEVATHKKFQDKIINNIQSLEKEKLWTWEERLNQEVLEAEKLLKIKNNQAIKNNQEIQDNQDSNS